MKLKTKSNPQPQSGNESKLNLFCFDELIILSFHSLLFKPISADAEAEIKTAIIHSFKALN